MAHFAKIENNIVTDIIVADQNFINTLSGTWIQTSYNTRGGIHYDPNTNQPDGGSAMRKNYAGIGYSYDPVRDAFIPAKPYPSWSLNESTCLWEPPTPYPTDVDNVEYRWDEQKQNWIPKLF